MNHLHSTDERSANRDLLTGASGVHPAAQGLTEDIDPTREDINPVVHYAVEGRRVGLSPLPRLETMPEPEPPFIGDIHGFGIHP